MKEEQKKEQHLNYLFLKNNHRKSRFRATMEVTIYGEKKLPFQILLGKKKGQSEIMQILFHTQLEMWR